MGKLARMIGLDTIAINSLVTNFRQIAGIDDLSPEFLLEFEELAGTALQPRFPGALLVWPRPNRCSIYYALAANSNEWRRLRPLLIAFVGPTLTSFNGFSEPLLPWLPVEAFLLSTGLFVARLIPGDEIDIRKITRRSLVRMIMTIAETPTITHTVPEPTSRLLAHFIECLNGNDYQGAERILEKCKNEFRIDALNLSFLRIRLLSHFSDWSGILEMPEFPSLCYTRKPPVITATLLESLYQVHLAQFDINEGFEHQRSHWRSEVRFIARPLLRLPILQSSGVGALKLYALEVLETEVRDLDLENAILVYRDSIGELSDALDLAGRTGICVSIMDERMEEKPPLAFVQQALVDAEDANSLATITTALSNIEQLNDADRNELLNSIHFRSIWQSINVDIGKSLPPKDWADWLHRLSDSEFTSAFSVLQHAVNEWPASSIVDPVEIAKVGNALASIPDTPIARERIADSLPLLSSWVAEDPLFPRAGMLPIYEYLLYYLVDGARRATIVYDSATLLIRALLSIGITAIQYSSLLDDCLFLAGDGIGTRSVYWLLEILEETILHPAPNLERRQEFWYAVYARFFPVRAHFSLGQRFAIKRIGVSLGWETEQIEAIVVDVHDEREDRLRVALSGMYIAIYSLTQSAARQASQVLTEIAPYAKISISHDECGTEALKSMAKNADIFVVATASAKHAATGFIQQIRPRDKPLLFAAGRGFSSIVRAIEEFVLGIL